MVHHDCVFLILKYGGFPKSGYPFIAGWFLLENPMKKMDDLGVPPFMETTICFVLVFEAMTPSTVSGDPIFEEQIN